MSKIRLTGSYRIPWAESVHYADDEWVILSCGRTIRLLSRHGLQHSLRLPSTYLERACQTARLPRRALRLDKMAVVPVFGDSDTPSLVVVRGGRAYRIEPETGSIAQTLTLRQSRNPMHQSICVTASGIIVQAEYGANPERRGVPVYASRDRGSTWEMVYELPAGSARHVHSCNWDPVDRRIWICTGDFDGENFLLSADEEFMSVEWIGDGSQDWRTCGLLFEPDAVYFGMDSPLESSFVMRLDRKTRILERMQPLPGPVWYSKMLSDGWMLMATAVERGPAVESRRAKIFASRCGTHWVPVASHAKDLWPMPWFKNGTINFADGVQSSKRFFFSGEALRGLDGRVFVGSVGI